MDTFDDTRAFPLYDLETGGAITCVPTVLIKAQASSEGGGNWRGNAGYTHPSHDRGHCAEEKTGSMHAIIRRCLYHSRERKKRASEYL